MRNYFLHLWRAQRKKKQIVKYETINMYSNIMYCTYSLDPEQRHAGKLHEALLERSRNIQEKRYSHNNGDAAVHSEMMKKWSHMQTMEKRDRVDNTHSKGSIYMRSSVTKGSRQTWNVILPDIDH